MGKRRKFWKTMTAGAALLFCMILSAPFTVHGGSQVVEWSDNYVVVSPGSQTEVALFYIAEPALSKTTGIGLRIFFNSAQIESLKVIEPYGESLLANDLQAQVDEKDLDSDPSTDRYVGVAWMSVLGNWPSLMAMPIQLGRVSLAVQPDAETGQFGINLMASETAAGHNFQGERLMLIVP